MIERKIYSGWAFSENAQEKSEMNREIYNEIKSKAKIRSAGVGYAHSKYEVLDNPENLSILELALICDGGNLCFGYRVEGRYIVIHTD